MFTLKNNYFFFQGLREPVLISVAKFNTVYYIMVNIEQEIGGLKKENLK